MSYRADPGGNFASDAHRRLLCVLANPEDDFQTLDRTVIRIDRDDHLPLTDLDEIAELLSDLEADGDAEKDEEGNWRKTQQGMDVLCGPIATDGGREHPDA